MESLRLHILYPVIIILFMITIFIEINLISCDFFRSCSSSCGNIHNITFPFQLQSDPPNCGHGFYNLSCKNNRTILALTGDKVYYVEKINYQNYTIRLVSNISIAENNDCLTIPPDPISPYYLLLTNPYYPSWETEIRLGKSGKTRQISEALTFLSCKNPVLANPSYIGITPCVNRTVFSPNVKGKDYFYYAVFGNGFKVSDMETSCRIYHTTLVSSAANIKSFDDIHNAIVGGFELSWIQAFTVYNKRDDICYTDEHSNKVYCRKNMSVSRRIKEFLGLIYYYIQIGFYYTYEITFGRILRKMGINIQNITQPMEFQLALLLGSRTIIGVSFVIALFIYKWKRRHLSSYKEIEEFLRNHNNLIVPIRYSYSELKNMTQDFKTKLGEGGFGSVYKGKLRSGHFVAIKMLGKSKSSGQDFINEVATIGTIHHVNVVRLVGFCFEGSKRALVYEFMPNGSLDKFIFLNEESNKISLSSKEIHEISLGVARGIEYLHRGCDAQILHFDIKPHNILLDENFTPKVSDFGLARLCPPDNNVVSLTAVRGTIGYIAPELFYKNIGGVSDKSDVYSFGMLLMEMANRRRNLNPEAENSSEIFFPTWVYSRVSQGNVIGTLQDATGEESKTTKKLIVVALWCIQLKPCDRPSMKRVVEMLEGNVESLQMPPKPVLFPQERYVAEEATSTSTLSKAESSLS